MEAVNKGMAKGVMWTVLFKFVTRGIGLFSTVLLARLLVPAAFGLVAMAMAIVAGLEILSAFNLDVVLIQNQNAERKHHDTAWSFNLVAGAALHKQSSLPWIADFRDPMAQEGYPSDPLIWKSLRKSKSVPPIMQPSARLLPRGRRVSTPSVILTPRTGFELSRMVMRRKPSKV